MNNLGGLVISMATGALLFLSGAAHAQSVGAMEVSVQLVGSLNEAEAARAVTRLNAMPGVSNARVRGGIVELSLAPGASVSVSAIDSLTSSIVAGTRVQRGRLTIRGPFDLLLAASHDPTNDAALLAAFQTIRFVSNVSSAGPRRFAFELASGRSLQASALLQKYLASQPPGGRVAIEELLHDIVFRAPAAEAPATH